MIISEIKELLLTSKHPVARVLFIKDGFRVLAIGFLKDMILQDHKTPYHSKLVVIEGQVNYKQGSIEKVLHQYDEFIIETNQMHSVTALDDSLCFLIQA